MDLTSLKSLYRTEGDPAGKVQGCHAAWPGSVSISLHSATENAIQRLLKASQIYPCFPNA